MPEKDYSFRALIDKLNVKPGARVVLLGVHDEALAMGRGSPVTERMTAQPGAGNETAMWSSWALKVWRT